MHKIIPLGTHFFQLLVSNRILQKGWLYSQKENSFPSDSISINNNNNRKKSMNFICNACKMNTKKKGKIHTLVSVLYTQNKWKYTQG